MPLDFALALNHKLADIAPPLLPSGLLLVLIDLVPEDHLPTVLAALRAAAARLHEMRYPGQRACGGFFATAA
jgi:hypothetical protein